MKRYHFGIFILIFTVVSCEKKPIVKDNTVTILVGKDSKVRGATVVGACRGFIRDGVNPNKIYIKSSISGISIRLSSENGVDPAGPLQDLYGPGKYQGQIVLLRRNSSKTLFAGSLKKVIWYIVDEDTPTEYMIRTVSSKPEVSYMLYDIENFQKNMPNITVSIKSEEGE